MGRRKPRITLVGDEFWGKFDAIELQTVITDGETDAENRPSVSPIMSLEDVGYNDQLYSYTIYGHLKTGGVEALADCPTPELARALGWALGKVAGLTIYDYLVEWDEKLIER